MLLISRSIFWSASSLRRITSHCTVNFYASLKVFLLQPELVSFVMLNFSSFMIQDSIGTTISQYSYTLTNGLSSLV
jgi:hypothetical protein